MEHVKVLVAIPTTCTLRPPGPAVTLCTVDFDATDCLCVVFMFAPGRCAGRCAGRSAGSCTLCCLPAEVPFPTAFIVLK